jgi:hypothetical protein
MFWKDKEILGRPFRSRNGKFCVYDIVHELYSKYVYEHMNNDF